MDEIITYLTGVQGTTLNQVIIAIWLVSYSLKRSAYSTFLQRSRDIWYLVDGAVKIILIAFCFIYWPWKVALATIGLAICYTPIFSIFFELVYNYKMFRNPFISFLASKRKPIGPSTTKLWTHELKVESATIKLQLPLFNKIVSTFRGRWKKLAYPDFKTSRNKEYSSSLLSAYDWNFYQHGFWLTNDPKVNSYLDLQLEAIRASEPAPLSNLDNMRELIKSYLLNMEIKRFLDNDTGASRLEFRNWTTWTKDNTPFISFNLDSCLSEGDVLTNRYIFAPLNEEIMLAFTFLYSFNTTLDTESVYTPYIDRITSSCEINNRFTFTKENSVMSPENMPLLSMLEFEKEYKTD